MPVLLKNVRDMPKDFQQKGPLLSQMCSYVLAYGSTEEEDTNQVLWTLSQYGNDIQESPYILERLLLQLDDCSTSLNLDLLLVTGIKVFLKSPAESQHVLGGIFQRCSQNHDERLKEKVVFYSKLLHQHPELCYSHFIPPTT